MVLNYLIYADVLLSNYSFTWFLYRD